MPLMDSDTVSPARIQGFHGGSEMEWKALVEPSVLFGACNAIECARFLRGAAGLHAHNHTEELWLVVPGRAQVPRTRNAAPPAGCGGTYFVDSPFDPNWADELPDVHGAARSGALPAPFAGAR